MRARWESFIVGIFVIASVALIIGLTVFFGGSRYFEPKVMAETMVTESVSGLTRGSPVKFRGVPVGTVSAIEFFDMTPGRSSDDGTIFTAPVRVVMRLERRMFDVDDQAMFNREVARGRELGFRARLTPAGLTGGPTVELSMMPASTAPEVALPSEYQPRYAYIPSVPGILTEFVDRASVIMASLAEVDFKSIAENLNDVLKNSDRVLSEEIAPAASEARGALSDIRVILADKRIEAIVGNVDSVTGSLASALGGDSSVNLKAFIEGLPPLVTRVREVVDNIDAVVRNPKIDDVVDSLAANVGPTLVSIRQAADRINELVAREQFDVHELITSLRSLIENLDRLAVEVKRDPSQLIFSRPPPPFEPSAPRSPQPEGRVQP